MAVWKVISYEEPARFLFHPLLGGGDGILLNESTKPGARCLSTY